MKPSTNNRNCFLRCILLFEFIIISHHAFNQNFKVVNINTSQYPVIKATFLATGLNGQKILDARPNDFSITENKAKCNIIEVTNPKEISSPASITMVFDVSLSMAGERLRLAKKAAREFIEQIPLETSEIAITSFSNDAFINCDFTQSQERLFEAIESLSPISSTSYTQAFLNANSGALPIVKNGRFKKCIVFLTDGLSNTFVDEIVSIANQNNISIYCITLELHIPDQLRDISKRTNGMYFETIARADQLDGIYSSIYQSLEIAKYGSISWKAAEDCKKDRSVHLVFRNSSIDFNYDVPKNKIGTLDLDPSILAFGNATAGTTKNLTVDIIARNIPLNITHISLADKGPFSVTDSLIYPYLLKPDIVKNINLSYKPADSRMVSSKLIVSTKECPDKSIVLLGGSDEQLRLICPKGGEKLIVGTDTSIRWEGVRKDKDISLSYRVAPEKSWIQIANSHGLIFPWITPGDTSHQVQVKLQPVMEETGELFLSATIPAQRSGIRGAFFSKDGSKLITTDGIGAIKLWDTESGRLFSPMEGFRSTTAIFSNDDKNIISFSRDETFVWDTQTKKLSARQPVGNRIIFTSTILPDGTEKLLSCNVMKDMANTYKLWMPGTNRSAFIFEKDFIQSASLSADGSKALTLSSDNVLKIWNITSATNVVSNYQPGSPISIIINPNGKTALVIGPGTLTMIELKNGNELFHIQRYTYKRFAESGDMIIARALDSNNMVLMDSYTGKPLSNVNFFKCLNQGYKILYYKNDSITILDVLSRKKLFQAHKPGVIDAVLCEDNHKIATIMQSNVIDIIDVTGKDKPHRIGDIHSEIKTATFSPNGKSIMILMEDNSFQYWSPKGKSEIKEVISGYFSIISPKPKVKKSIRFDDQFLHQPKELVVKDFISNPTKYKIKINKIELIDKDSSAFEMISDGSPAILEPLGLKSGEFRFTPTHLGQSKKWIRTCTPTDTFMTELVGRGIVKKFELSNTGIDFGKVKVHQHKDTLATILTNQGSEPFTITDVIMAGPDKQQFSLTEGKNLTILSKASLTVKVRFSPKFRGKTTGSLLIKIQGVSDPQFIQLIGEGLATKELWVNGKTLNSTDSLPLTATLNCIDLVSGNVIKQVKTNQTGNFGFYVSADRNYGLVAEKQDFLSTSENIDIREATLLDTITRNIYLTQIKGGASIRMNCIFFEFAKANLLTSSNNDLTRILEILNSHESMTMELQGHTDSIGSDMSNMQLSMQRAKAVKNYLVAQGVNAERLSVKAFGESKPVATNSTEEGRQLNRRVEIKIMKY